VWSQSRYEHSERIGRRREKDIREVGEGTNKNVDIDQLTGTLSSYSSGMILKTNGRRTERKGEPVLTDYGPKVFI